MMKAGPWGQQMGGPWGQQMGGPWGQQMGGPWGMNPWMNPNMTAAEREKLTKSGPWGGMASWGNPNTPLNAPWLNPSLSPEEKEALLKSAPFEALGPWTQGAKAPRKDSQQSEKSNEKGHWKIGETDDTSPDKISQTRSNFQEVTRSQIEPVLEMNNDIIQVARMQQSTSGYIETDTKYELCRSVKTTMEDLKVLEEKRKNLSMRPDFSLSEIYEFVNKKQSGYVELNDLNAWSRDSNINLTREDWAVLLDRFDKDGDGYLSFSEFIVMFVPLTKSYQTSMTSRQPKGAKSCLDLTVQTKRLVRDLLYAIITAEDNFEVNKHNMTGNSVIVMKPSLFLSKKSNTSLAIDIELPVILCCK